MPDSPSPSGSPSPYEMVKSIELRKFLDIAEKEGIIYNKLKIRQGRVDEYQNDIEHNIVKNLNLNDAHITYDRGSKLVEQKIIFHKYWVKQLYLAHKILIPILVAILFFILIYKSFNK